MERNINEIHIDGKLSDDIIRTLKVPLIILDSKLKVISANHSFYQTFHVSESETIEEYIYNLGNGQWNIPELIKLLKETLPEKTIIEDYEVEHKFEEIGEKTMLLNARELIQEQGKDLIMFGLRPYKVMVKL